MNVTGTDRSKENEELYLINYDCMGIQAYRMARGRTSAPGSHTGAGWSAQLILNGTQKTNEASQTISKFSFVHLNGQQRTCVCIDLTICDIPQSISMIALFKWVGGYSNFKNKV
jgi:hypothetical protein